MFFFLSGLFVTCIIYPLTQLIKCNHLIADGLVRKFFRDEDGIKFYRPSPSYDQKVILFNLTLETSIIRKYVSVSEKSQSLC